MNKTIMRNALVLSLACSGLVRATHEFRSPLSVDQGMMHYPLTPVPNAWWNELMQGRDEKSWEIYAWATAYSRSADRAFFDPEENKTTTKTAPLSVLWFGQSAFVGADAFANSLISPETLAAQNAQSLGFLRVFPDFDYNEKGATFGMWARWNFGCDEMWHLGGRINLPFKVIEMEQDGNCRLQETLDDVVQFRPLNLTGLNEFAARLDFLNSLVYPTIPGMTAPVVQFDNGSGVVGTETKITGSSAAATAVTDDLPGVFLIRRDAGNLPAAPFRKAAPPANPSQLPANGLGGGENSLFFFGTPVNYQAGLGQNSAAQRTLFVVPRSTNGDLVGNADIISQNLFALLDVLSIGGFDTTLDFFQQRGINLCARDRITGVGDLTTDFFIGYGDPNYCWFVDFVLGAVWPTGKKLTDVKRVFFQSTGHNRHFESKIGLDGGWRPCEWFAFEIDGYYYHSFKRTERKAAPFRGATVRNIGPQVDAKVSWNYFVGHANLNFFHPCNPDLGVVVGYEIFAKGKDKVRLEQTTATDLLGRSNQPLDAEILENRTNVITHKLRGEVFQRWFFGEVFGGASHIVAGKNAMKESEVHIGMAFYF